MFSWMRKADGPCQDAASFPEMTPRLKTAAVLLFLSIVALPFTCLPIKLSFVLRSLPVYFFFPAAILLLPEMFRLFFREKALQLYAVVCSAFLIWGIAVSVASNHFSLEGVKMALLFAKGIIIWYGIGFGYAMMFRVLPEKVRWGVLRYGLYTMIALSSVHALIEILWFFEVPGCEWILVRISRTVRASGFYGWWPPELWPGRVRSWFAEPSNCATAMNCSIVLLAADAILRKKMLSLWFCIPAQIMMMLAFSRCGFLFILVAIPVICLYPGALKGRPRLRLLFLSDFVLIFVFCFLEFGGMKYITGSNQGLFSSITEEKEDTRGDLFYGSGHVRYYMVKLELSIVQDHWLCGGGYGSWKKETLRRLSELDEKDITEPEILNWMNVQELPELCQYTSWLVEYGVIGCLLAVFVVTFPLIRVFFRGKNARGPDHAVLCGIVAAGILSLCASLVSLIMYMFSLMLLWGALFALSIGREKENGNGKESCHVEHAD